MDSELGPSMPQNISKIEFHPKDEKHKFDFSFETFIRK